FFHAVRNDFRQLLLAQFGVFHNVALNAIAIGLQFSPERLKLTEETINFAHRSLWYLAQQIAEMLARRFAIAARTAAAACLTLGGLIHCLTGVALRFSLNNTAGGGLLLGGKPSHFSFDQAAKLGIELRARMRVVVGDILYIWSNQFI